MSVEFSHEFPLSSFPQQSKECDRQSQAARHPRSTWRSLIPSSAWFLLFETNNQSEWSETQMNKRTGVGNRCNCACVVCGSCNRCKHLLYLSLGGTVWKLKNIESKTYEYYTKAFPGKQDQWMKRKRTTFRPAFKRSFTQGYPMGCGILLHPQRSYAKANSSATQINLMAFDDLPNNFWKTVSNQRLFLSKLAHDLGILDVRLFL